MSEILYSALKNVHIKEILADLQKASSELEIDFFGVGALARNVWYVEDGEPARGTKDLDFAVYVPSVERYEGLKDKLVKDYDYTIISTNAFCLIDFITNGIV